MLKSHVTVIDDDASALSSVCALLTAFGYQVSSFESAEEFLESEGASSSQCLLIDIQLPGMTGRELQIALKNAGCLARIILISGNADTALAREALGDGAIAVLEKPVAPAALIDQVRRAISDPEPSQTG